MLCKQAELEMLPAWFLVSGWLQDHTPSWEALSAVSTFVATLVALFLPLALSRREQARQLSLRAEDSANAMKAIRDVRHEVCSTVDQILAYRTAAIAIMKTEPVYLVGVEAITRIRDNVVILIEVLALLESRSELSDGAVYSAVAGRNVGRALFAQLDPIVEEWGQRDPRWSLRVTMVKKLEALAARTRLRTAAVRSDNDIGPGETAARITEKYGTLADAIEAAKVADSGAPSFDFGTDHL